MISNCGHDERNKYSGGKAGDQTGQEWAVINWYNRPWNVVLRHPIDTVGKKIATYAEAAAKNNNIGYDQNQRYTFWNALKNANYDPAKINTLCEADCSAGVAAIIKAVGYTFGMKSLKDVSIYAYTGNLKNVLVNAGFTPLYDEKYLTSDNYLLPGDILLYEGHHTAINLGTGKYAFTEAVKEYPYWVQTNDGSWYYRIGDRKNQTGFANINGHRYYFDSTGKMQKGWFQVDGDWYYGQPSGGLEGAIYTADKDGKQSILEV